MKKLFLILAILTATTSLNAANLKKVLILDFINIEKNANFTYLEASITDATVTKLGEKFAFQQMQKSNWQDLMARNHMFREDAYTKSTGMTMGLLGKQDVVICGGFYIKDNKGEFEIITNVQILDISKTKVIAEFKESGPADNRIFETIDRIASRIVKEAESVLPNKKEWQGEGFDDTPFVIFENYSLGFRAGAGMYALGYADRIKAKMPSFGALIKANMPIIWDKLIFEINGTFFNHEPVKEESPAIENLNVVTTNYIFGGSFGTQFGLSKNSYLYPKIGGGYVMQNTVITGDRNETVANGFPFVSFGLDFGYGLNAFTDLIVGFQEIGEIESGTFTLYNQLNLGINIKF
ncbi:MAG: hypothetical protein OEZ13_05910 [Spirochaetia bacterium]|nr:hypothetical protein [Spirochaetia bacterium]